VIMPRHTVEKPHRFILNLPETMYSQIEQAAEHDGISQNHFIRRAITFYLKEGREP